MFEVEDFLNQQGINYSKVSGGKQLILEECPHCGKKRKLYIEVKTGKFICFRCNEKGGPVKLVSDLAQIDIGAAKDIVYGKSKDIAAHQTKDKRNELELFEDEPPSLTTIELKKEFIRVSERPEECAPAIDYLKKRGLTEADIEASKAMYWPYAKRVVFVSYVMGSPVGWVARDITGEADIKTINYEGPFRRLSVWNYDSIKQGSDIVITEGTFDAIKAGLDRSVALFGSFCSPQQLEMIVSKNPKMIYLLLDRDAIEKAIETYQMIKDSGLKVEMVIIPEILNESGGQKDPGEMTREEIDKIIYDPKNWYSPDVGIF